MVPTTYAQSDKQIFQFLRALRQQGQPAALVTVTDIERTGPRPRGSHMAVSITGDRVGYVTSGCLEQAVAGDAVAAMKDNADRIVRYGENSQYLDFRLPCGGGMAFHIHVDPDLALLDRCLTAMERREPFGLAFEPNGGRVEFLDDHAVATGWVEDKFLRRYAPALRFVLVGSGAELEMMTRLASAAGYEVLAYSSDESILALCQAHDVQIFQLTSAQHIPPLPNDQWTAFIFLFHEHELEYPLIKAALGGPAFYIGALGSKRTQATRLANLRQAGVDEATLARIGGPIGLIPSARDPAILAISVVAEVVDRYRQLEMKP